jgi:hypothetical protein
MSQQWRFPSLRPRCSSLVRLLSSISCASYYQERESIKAEAVDHQAAMNLKSNGEHEPGAALISYPGLKICQREPLYAMLSVMKLGVCPMPKQPTW